LVPKYRVGDHVYVIDPIRMYRVCGVWREESYVLLYVGPKTTEGQEPFMVDIEQCEDLFIPCTPAMLTLLLTAKADF
jgi:hypothetical protein